MTSKTKTHYDDCNYVGYNTLTGVRSQVSRQLVYTDSFTGTGLRGYRRILQKGGEATTPATGVKYEVTINSGNCVWSYFRTTDKKSWEAGTSGIFRKPSFASMPMGSSSKVYNLALGSFYGSLSEAVSQFKGGPFLGELGETLRLISKPTRSISRITDAYLSSCKKHGGRKFTSVASEINKAYLEWTFGVAPLLGDIRDGVKALNSLNSRAPSVRVHGFARDDLTSSVDSIETSLYSGGDLGMATTRSTTSIEVSLTGAVVCNTPKTAHTVPNALGFRLEEFVPTVWELLPYSFMVDYFSNVGDVLNAYANLGIGSKFYCSSVRRVGRLEYDFRPTRSVNAWFQSCSGHQGWTTTATTWTRTKFEPSPPSFAFQLPNVKQWVNIASVVAAGHSISSKLR